MIERLVLFLLLTVFIGQNLGHSAQFLGRPSVPAAGASDADALPLLQDAPALNGAAAVTTHGSAVSSGVTRSSLHGDVGHDVHHVEPRHVRQTVTAARALPSPMAATLGSTLRSILPFHWHSQQQQQQQQQQWRGGSRQLLQERGGPVGQQASEAGPAQHSPPKKRLPLPTRHADVALCAVMKNEQGNAVEWVQYHRWLGVGKFYIFDHGSSPPMAVELNELIVEGVVEVLHFGGNSWLLDAPRYQSPIRQFLSPQGWAYDTCFRLYAKRHKWMGMLDVDEFVVIKGPPGVTPSQTEQQHQHQHQHQQHLRGKKQQQKVVQRRRLLRLMQEQQQQPNGTVLEKPDIGKFLSAFDGFGGLMMHWKLMGPSNHVKKPKVAAMLAYTNCIPKHRMVTMSEFRAIPLGFMKSFTNTKHYHAGCNPHQCALDGASYVNELGQKLSNEIVTQVHWDRIVVMHYVTRSIQEFTYKMARGSGHSQYLEANRRAGRTGRTWAYFLGIHERASQNCTEGVDAYLQCCASGMCQC